MRAPVAMASSSISTPPTHLRTKKRADAGAAPTPPGISHMIEATPPGTSHMIEATSPWTSHMIEATPPGTSHMIEAPGPLALPQEARGHD